MPYVTHQMKIKDLICVWAHRHYFHVGSHLWSFDFPSLLQILIHVMCSGYVVWFVSIIFHATGEEIHKQNQCHEKWYNVYQAGKQEVKTMLLFLDCWD